MSTAKPAINTKKFRSQFSTAMPIGTPPLEVKLRVVETGHIAHEDVRGIKHRLGELFRATSGWSSTFGRGEPRQGT